MQNLLSSFSKKIKKVIGKFKDEAAGNIITECVAPKPKMYSYETEIIRKKYMVKCIN